jgi:hypothetical protein
MGTVVGWCKEDPVEIILLTVFFVKLGIREMHSHNACFPRIEIGDMPP